MPCLLQNFLFTKCGILVEESRFEEDVEGVTFKRIRLGGIILMQLNCCTCNVVSRRPEGVLVGGNL